MAERDNKQVNEYVFDTYLAFCFIGDKLKKYIWQGIKSNEVQLHINHLQQKK